MRNWSSSRRLALDEMEMAHRGVGGAGRGRRYATQQINQAYAVLLSSQFQGFCRDFHTECTDYFVQGVTAGVLRTSLRNVLLLHRKLKTGNANPGNIGEDFNRFGLSFWDEVLSLNQRSKGRQDRLTELNTWRNAIAHQDFDLAKLGGTSILQLRDVRDWRRACNYLATTFEDVMRTHLQFINSAPPW